MFKNIKYGFNCIVNCKFIICISFIILSSASKAQNLTQYSCSGQIFTISIPYPSSFFQVVNARNLEEAQLLATKIFNQQYNPDGMSFNSLYYLSCQAGE
jgi:hypothetical protein